MHRDRFWIGTSWKMNKTLAEARAYAERIGDDPVWRGGALQGFVMPPFTALATVCDILAASPVRVGGQTMHWADQGAFTGEIAAPMLRDVGADLVELGHSERRALFAETDETVNRKVHAALRHGLAALVCVGETEPERRAGASAEAVVRQVRIALGGVRAEEMGRVLIAYEPVWAIGEGGVPATPAHAARIHAAVRAALRAMFPDAPGFTLLYGGSVDAANCAGLAAEAEIDGLFIGRAAWGAEGLLAIARSVLPVVAAKAGAGLQPA